jgi:membrane protein
MALNVRAVGDRLGPLLRRLGPLLERLAAVAPVQAGVVLGAQAFLALFPLLIALFALTPSGVGTAAVQTLRSRLGVTGETEDSINHLISGRSELHGGYTAMGAVIVLASATAFTRALQRVYENSWQLPRMGLRGTARGLLWLVGALAYLVVLGSALRLTTGLPVDDLLRAILSVAGAFALWWWTPYLLLSGRVRARALLPTAITTSVTMVALGRASQLIMPRTIASNERQFGTIGVVFAVESWLVVVACAIVAAAVIGAVGAQLPGPLGRLLSGSADPDGWRRTPPRRIRARRRDATHPARRHPPGSTREEP